MDEGGVREKKVKELFSRWLKPKCYFNEVTRGSRVRWTQGPEPVVRGTVRKRPLAGSGGSSKRYEQEGRRDGGEAGSTPPTLTVSTRGER